jgi:hypothetical protein
MNSKSGYRIGGFPEVFDEQGLQKTADSAETASI